MRWWWGLWRLIQRSWKWYYGKYEEKKHESNVDIDYDELHNHVDIDDDQNNKGQERKKTNMELWDQMSCWTWI